MSSLYSACKISCSHAHHWSQVLTWSSCVPSAWQDLWSENRPAHSVLLPQAGSGHRERGRKDRWDVLLVWCVCSHSSFYPLSPSCKGHTSLPGLSLGCDWCYIHDVGELQQRKWSVQKRELWISTFTALGNLQPRFSCWFLIPPLHHLWHTHTSTLSSFVPYFSMYSYWFVPSLYSLFTFWNLFCVWRPRDGGDGVCEGSVWDCPGESPGWVLQNEECLPWNRRQKHNWLGPVAGHHGCQRVSPNSFSALIIILCWPQIPQTWPVCTQAEASPVVYIWFFNEHTWCHKHKDWHCRMTKKQQVNDPGVICRCCYVS